MIFLDVLTDVLLVLAVVYFVAAVVRVADDLRER